MENDMDNNIIEISDSNIFKYKLDYENQNVDNNKLFQKWKEQTRILYGDDSKIFKCLNDKMFFCCSYEECIKFPLYKATCPNCHNDICYFCSKTSTDKAINGDCCIKRRFMCMIFQDGEKYIKKIKGDNYRYLNYKLALLWFFTPFSFCYVVQLFLFRCFLLF